MPRDLHIVTRGLPTPGSPTHWDRTFHWLFVDDTLTIPKHQSGQSEFDADDPDQHAWLERHAATWMRGVWHCVWKWNIPAARNQFLAVLAPLDPQADAIASALSRLEATATSRHREAIEDLLELTASNLAAAVPSLTLAQRSPDAELRAQATVMLYRWHHRSDPDQLAPLFGDNDPAVRAAALREFQRHQPWQEESFVCAQLPLVLERLSDHDPGVREEAQRAVEAAARRGFVSSRGVPATADDSAGADADPNVQSFLRKFD